ncbi:uncharacterized protein LOC125944388 [Dermacentor silvarum]|uniref:uncharacterized protein LOC125944388 n=1 Tax=Dermacentor silvarum TaxID=543639 RepID=UPI0021017EDC|nr:uncharacterized protein LOC125944388 [Dermacentor silvarum]
MLATPGPVPATGSDITTGQPTSTRKSRRVRFTLPSGRVVCPRIVELAARDTVILATGAAVAYKRASPGDAAPEPGPSSGPVAQKRIVYRGGIPLKRYKRCHRIDNAAGGDSIRSGAETSSRDDKLNVNHDLVSSANSAATLHHSTADDGFMEEIMAMAED